MDKLPFVGLDTVAQTCSAVCSSHVGPIVSGLKNQGQKFTKGVKKSPKIIDDIIREKSEYELQNYLIGNSEEVARNPTFIGALSVKINTFESKDLIGEILYIFDIALSGGKAIECAANIMKCGFCLNIKDRIVAMYRLPSPLLLNILLRIADIEGKRVDVRPEQLKELKGRINEIVVTHELEFTRYACNNQIESPTVVSLLSDICERFVSNCSNPTCTNQQVPKGNFLTKILWKYNTYEKVCEPCLRALAALTFKKEDAAYEMQKYANQVVKAMRAHKGNTRILREGFKVITNIAKSSEAVKRIIDEKGSELIVESLDDYKNPGARYQYWGARALWELSKDGYAKVVLEKDQKLIAIMVGGFIENRYDIKFVYPCCAFLDSIRFTETLFTMISMHEGLDSLNYIVHVHAKDADMVRVANSLIAKITSFESHTSQQPTATQELHTPLQCPVQPYDKCQHFQTHPQCPVQPCGNFPNQLQLNCHAYSSPNLARQFHQSQQQLLTFIQDSQFPNIPISVAQSNAPPQYAAQAFHGSSSQGHLQLPSSPSSSSQSYYLSKSSRSTGETSQCCIRQSSILSYNSTDPDYYITFEESLAEAKFINTKFILKYTNETATYLSKNGTLKKYGMSDADSMAITAYTYDNGPDQFEDNPCRIINKALGERNVEAVLRVKRYVLRLLVALRKLPPYSGNGPLYRAVSGTISPLYSVVGSEVFWPAFTSTSSDENSVISFINDSTHPGKKYIFELRGCFKKGHSIKEFSFHPDEEGT